MNTLFRLFDCLDKREMIMNLHASGMSAEEIAMRLKKDIAMVRQILQ